MPRNKGKKKIKIQNTGNFPEQKIKSEEKKFKNIENQKQQINRIFKITDNITIS